VKKRIAVILGVMVALAGIALAVYAAYDLSGSSSAESFTSGTAANLTVDPQSEDLNGILPGQTSTMDVLITNPNNVPATVTGLSLAFNDNGLCGFSVTPLGNYPFGLGGGASAWVQVNVGMGNADPSCEGNSNLTVTATATGTLP
jgi:hypothetical protein